MSICATCGTISDIETEARFLASMRASEDPNIVSVFWAPHEHEIRILETTSSVLELPDADDVVPLAKIFFDNALRAARIVSVHPNDWARRDDLDWPEGFETLEKIFDRNDSPPLSIHDLCHCVTNAVLRAEKNNPSHGIDSYRRAWLAVSEYEDQISAKLAANEVEGAIARRGAVRAAITAGDHLRAEGLVGKYLYAGVPTQLADELEAELIKVPGPWEPKANLQRP